MQQVNKDIIAQENSYHESQIKKKEKTIDEAGKINEDFLRQIEELEEMIAQEKQARIDIHIGIADMKVKTK